MHDRKRQFVYALAEYLTHRLAAKSVRLQMGDEEAKLWAKAWGLSTLSGYPTAEEAAERLAEFLGIELNPPVPLTLATEREWETAQRAGYRVFFEVATQTFRMCPENYCLVTRDPEATRLWRVYRDEKATLKLHDPIQAALDAVQANGPVDDPEVIFAALLPLLPPLEENHG